MTQMVMAQYLADPLSHERVLREALSRVSQTLFRVADAVDLTGLSLEVDLQGIHLTHEGEAREQEEKKKKAS